MKRQIRYITINTDGSFCPDTKSAGYAFYIKSDTFKIQQGGIIKADPVNSEEAELMTLCNAVYVLSKSRELFNTEVKVIVVNIDCKGVIDKIKSYNRDPLYVKFRELLEQLKHKIRCRDIRIKHVKGHVKIKDKRSWVNDWCDKTAKSYMKQERLKRVKKNNTYNK